jgi:hypothetical protein
MIPDRGRLAAIADLIGERILIKGPDQFCRETGIAKEDFVKLSLCSFNGEISAVDGSNAVVCDWSVASLNRIRAGYAVYRGHRWQRTVITYDDLFLADRNSYSRQFDAVLKTSFNLQHIDLRDEELDRLSSYFRELQEYIALGDAINEAAPGDLVVYDGGFSWKSRPLGKALEKIFQAAEERDVELLGVSKSSSLSWGGEFSRPLVNDTSIIGSQLMPGSSWFVNLKGKNVDPGPDGLDIATYVARFDGRSDHAFRVDVPSYLEDKVAVALGKLAASCSSAECTGYPHPLFRAHRDLKIGARESEIIMFELLDLLGSKGLSASQVRRAMIDYHDIIDMQPRRAL